MEKLYYLFSLLLMLALSVFTFAQPANNNCSGAIDLSSSLMQGVGNVVNAGTYDNTDATTGNDDPTDGFDCFNEPDGYGGMPSLDNTLWFKITGDGNDYYIHATSTDCAVTSGINGNDTQMAIYTGSCGALTPVACNEDFTDWTPGDYPAAILLSTVVGETYYILVDGFNLNGNLAEGEFCMFVTQQVFIACDNPSVSGGIASASTTAICAGESTNITIEDALAPNEGALTGYAWVISTEDLQENPDFVVNQNYLAGLEVTSEPVSPLNLTPSNYGIFNPGTTYYFTLVAFGNANWTNPSQQVFISQTNLDAACTTLSNSVQIDYCLVSTLEVDESVLGMTIFPNPVQDLMNLNIHAMGYSEATIMLTNIAGQMVKQQNINLISGANIFNLDMSNVPTGVYMVSIETESHQSVSRFIKQ